MGSFHDMTLILDWPYTNLLVHESRGLPCVSTLQTKRGRLQPVHYGNVKPRDGIVVKHKSGRPGVIGCLVRQNVFLASDQVGKVGRSGHH